MPDRSHKQTGRLSDRSQGGRLLDAARNSAGAQHPDAQTKKPQAIVTDDPWQTISYVLIPELLRPAPGAATVQGAAYDPPRAVFRCSLSFTI